ncbi:MAG TPA: Rv3654c family TadE-like protein [Gaiellaceae bacterium]|nr:Rv3654c family TadE-like protein [Gaiellaceae bacterium]
MNRIRSDRGQATVLTVIFLVALLGAAALVLDVGSWFREQRDTQGAADAAALAAAQALPDSPAQAEVLAASYVAKNRGGELTTTYGSKNLANDTVTVEVERSAPGIFAKLFGIDSVQVDARASARVGGLDQAKWVAPIVVNIKHPKLNCGTANGKPVPCFGQPTKLDLHHLHQPGSGDAAGSFGLINLDIDSGGNTGASTVASWMENGFDEYMGLGAYHAVPSSNFNNGQFKSALKIRLGDDLLFPIYKKITGSGQNAKYDVAGWVGFNVTSFHAGGSSGEVHGSFTKVIWEGIQSASGDNANWGALAIELVE